MILVVPALPRAEGFRVLAEPSKVFTLEGSYQDNNLKGQGGFRIAAMGGDITFSPLTFSLALDSTGNEVDGQFNAHSSCLKINGNGSKYSFPNLMVNLVCDPWLNIVAVGSFHGRAVHNQDLIMNPIEGQILSRNVTQKGLTHLKLHLSAKDTAVISEPHLFTWVEFDNAQGKILSHGSTVIAPDKIASDGNWNVEFKVKNDYQLFLDAEALN
jgi:hypothetical protein